MVAILRLSTYMQLISVVFHPTFMPIYTFTSIWYLYPESMTGWSSKQQLSFFVLLLMSYTIFPSLLVYSAHTLGWISKLNVSQHERRIMLLLLSCWYMLTSIAWMKWNALPTVILTLLSTATALLFVLWALNFVLKISVHAAGTATVAAYCIALGIDSSERSLFELGALFIICTGLVISSRLYLRAHKASEVYTGALVGFGIGTYGHTFF